MLTPDEIAYLLALASAESDFDEESRHLSEECSEAADSALEKLRAMQASTTLAPHRAMEQIHLLLDGTEWDSDTTSAIAEVVRAAGYEIREPDDACPDDPDGMHHVGCGCE